MSHPSLWLFALLYFEEMTSTFDRIEKTKEHIWLNRKSIYSYPQKVHTFLVRSTTDWYAHIMIGYIKVCEQVLLSGFLTVVVDACFWDGQCCRRTAGPRFLSTR